MNKVDKISYIRAHLDGIICLFFCIIIFIVYHPILNNQFLESWDDQWVVLNYFTEGGINLSNLWDIFSSYYHGQYSPLNECLYLVLYTFNGYDPFYFHLASLLLHIANASILYVVLKKLLRMSKRIAEQKINLLAFLTVLVFIVHPLNVESIAWLSASKVLLYSLFYFLAIYTFLKYLNTNKKRYYLYTVVLFICSFFSKEQAVTFPLCILLVLWIVKFDFRNKKLFRIIVPLFLLSFVFGIITILSQVNFGIGPLHSENSYPFWQRCVFASYSLLEYLIKCLFPINLLYIYPFPNPPGSSMPTWFLLYPIILIILVYCFWKYLKKMLPLTFGLLFFFIHIIIALHIIPLSRFTIIADRYTYIALIGISFIIAFYVLKAYYRFNIKKRTAIFILLIAYILYLGIYANKRCKVWHDGNTLKKEIIEILEKRPDHTIFKYME